MEEHDEKAEELEREADELEEKGDRLERDIEEERSDLEGKLRDGTAPGLLDEAAAAPGGDTGDRLNDEDKEAGDRD